MDLLLLKCSVLMDMQTPDWYPFHVNTVLPRDLVTTSVPWDGGLCNKKLISYHLLVAFNFLQSA